MSDSLEVWMDADFLTGRLQIGTLTHDRSAIRFAYDPTWLQSGWRLAPAFDVNPNIEKGEHVLNLDESDNRPSLATVVGTAEWYSLSKDRGAKIVGEITEVTRRWREVAARAKIARADIELTAVAFAQSDI